MGSKKRSSNAPNWKNKNSCHNSTGRIKSGNRPGCRPNLRSKSNPSQKNRLLPPNDHFNFFFLGGGGGGSKRICCRLKQAIFTVRFMFNTTFMILSSKKIQFLRQLNYIVTAIIFLKSSQFVLLHVISKKNIVQKLWIIILLTEILKPFKKRRSCFSCRFTLALIKKICGGGIFFIFWKESTLFDMFYKNKTRLAQILLETAKTRILKPTII